MAQSEIQTISDVGGIPVMLIDKGNYENLLVGTETFSTLKNPKVSYVFEVGLGRGHSDNVTYTATGIGLGMRFYF